MRPQAAAPASNQLADRAQVTGDGSGTQTQAKPKRLKPLDESKLRAAVQIEMQNTSGLATGELAMNRRDALKYYMADPYGDELEGRSQVVTTEFRDTVESILPSLLKIFASSDDVVKFDPTQESEEDVAAQATDYVNHVFQKDNQGFLVLYSWFKDAMLAKNGIVKAWWDREETTERESYEAVTDQQLVALLQDDGVEPIAHRAYQIPMPVAYSPVGAALQFAPLQVHDVTIERKVVKGRARTVNVPGEEFFITQRAKSIKTAPFVAHKTQLMAFQLLEQGVKQDDIDAIPTDDEADMTQERIERFKSEGDNVPDNEGVDATVRRVWVLEAYLHIDLDGDGIAERIKVLMDGDYRRVLKVEEWDGDWPFYSVTPSIMPHKFFGLSIFDMVRDVQRIKSTLTRQLMDNIYGLNNNRWEVVENQVNMDDVLTNRVNGVVRTKAPGMLRPLPPQPIGQVILPALEYWDTVQESRTGVTKYNQGLDANSLNKTATGIVSIMNAAQERILLIARIFAETGVSDLFKGLLKLHCQHQDQARTVKMRGKWVEIDPSEWNDQMDVTVNVALGTNNRQEMLAHLMQVLQIQQQALALGLTTPHLIYNTLAKLIENAGLKDASHYFLDPSQSQSQGQPAGAPGQPQPQQPGQPPQDPRLAMHQAQLQSEAQTDAQAAQLRAQTDVAKIKSDADTRLATARMAQSTQLQIASSNQQLKREEMMLNARMKAQQIAAEEDTDRQVNMARMVVMAGRQARMSSAVARA